MNIQVALNQKDALDGARHALCAMLSMTQKNDVLLLASGDSAAEILNPVSDDLRDVVWNRLWIGVLDERYGVDKQNRNTTVLQKTTVWKSVARKNILTLPNNISSVKEAASRYAKMIDQWQKKHPKGIVMATCGIGHDGHTAGIMPYSAEDVVRFESLKETVIGYDAGAHSEYPLRVSVTLGFIAQHITQAVVYAVGHEKYDALGRLWAPVGTFRDTPARILRKIPQSVLFTDIARH